MRRRPRPETAAPRPRLKLGPERAARIGFDLAQSLLTSPFGKRKPADRHRGRAGNDRRGQAQLFRPTEIRLHIGIQLIHESRDHSNAAGSLDLLDHSRNNNVLALTTLGDGLGIGQVAHQLFRLSSVQDLSTGLKVDAVTLGLVLALVGLAKHHLDVAQAVHQSAQGRPGHHDVPLRGTLLEANNVANRITNEADATAPP